MRVSRNLETCNGIAVGLSNTAQTKRGKAKNFFPPPCYCASTSSAKVWMSIVFRFQINLYKKILFKIINIDIFQGEKSVKGLDSTLEALESALSSPG